MRLFLISLAPCNDLKSILYDLSPDFDGIVRAFTSIKHKGLYVSGLRVVLFALFLLGLASPVQAQKIEVESNNPPQTSQLFANQKQLVVRAPLEDGTEATITYTEFLDTTPDTVDAVLKDQSIKNADVVLATDQEKVIEKAALDNEQSGGNRLLRILPIGRLATAKANLAAGLKWHNQNVLSTLKGDRIGLGILAISIHSDYVVWMTSTSADTYQKASMIVFNLALASTFGLNRKLWGALSDPVKEKFLQTFDRLIPTENAKLAKSITSRLLGNLAVGTAMQFTRVGIFSLENFSHAIQTSDFWLVTAKISALVSLTTFGWSELYQSIDPQKNPRADLLMRRLSDARGFIMLYFATASMVLQPQIYGNTPVISYIVQGAAGFITFLFANRVINFLETNKVGEFFYRKLITLEVFIHKGLTLFRPGTNLFNITEQDILEAQQRLTSARRSTKPAESDSPVRTEARPAVRTVRSCRALIAG